MLLLNELPNVYSPDLEYDHRGPTHTPGGIYHYSCKEHALEQRLVLPKSKFEFPPDVFVVCLSSLNWYDKPQTASEGRRLLPATSTNFGVKERNLEIW